MAPPDPRFLRALALMRKLQLSGAVALRVQTEPDKSQVTLLTLRTAASSPESQEDSRELRGLLGLDPEATEFQAGVRRDRRERQGSGGADPFDPSPDADDGLAGRSAAAHLAEGRVTPGWESLPTDNGAPRLIRIHSSKTKPDDSFVAVSYRDHWFWIDDRDLKTKAHRSRS